MDLPANPGNQKAQYIIKAKKNLSYKLSKLYDEKFSWFCWEDAATNKTDGYILKNVDCEANPGEITAVAGPSGAGKTSLLEILAGMIVQSRVSGHEFVNNKPMNAMHFRRLSGFVTQDEALFPLLTVEETLVYSARLRLHGGLVKATASQRVVEGAWIRPCCWNENK